MGRQRKKGRPVNGILLLDKPIGVTSNGALQAVKRLFFARKAGHTGSLDPLASGLLPICLGEATKISPYLLDSDKRYHVKVQLGQNTATGDAEGDVIQERPVGSYSATDIEGVLADYRGGIEQIPPMYSALKHEGRRLYDLAREGIVVERQPRPITIFELHCLDYTDGVLELDVLCSKGTYIRTLAEDIGNQLGCGGHVSWLRRTGVGPYSLEDTLDMPALEALAEQGGHSELDNRLLPIETALDHWPQVKLSANAEFYLKQGQAVIVPHAPTDGCVRLYSAAERFMGVGEILDDGKVAPKRMMNFG